MAVDIVFDYSYDDSGFFDTQAKAALERAATDYETRLLDTLSAIPAPTAGNSWTASFQDPETGSTVNLPNLQLAENEVRVFVGSRNLTGTTLGKASTGYGVQYTDPNWVDTVLWRGQSGANEQSTWGGSIAFDTTPTWHFDAGLPTSGTPDLYSVALHELGHIFGISNQPGNTWTSYATPLNELSPADQALVDNEPGDYFTGPKSVALYGSPIPVDGGHFEHDVSYAGAEAALDPNLTTGTRKPMSPLDWTALDDIGWDVGTRFLSGTVFDDSVIDNDQPDAGEGEAGLTVTATNTTTSTQYTTTTHTDGTYALELPPGTYDVTFTGGSHEGRVEMTGNAVGAHSIKIELDTAQAVWGSFQPTVPQNVSIFANSATSATLTWDDSEHETSYQIYRWNNKTNTEIITLAANETSYTPTNLIPGEREWFYVKAVNGSQSAQSEWQLMVMPLVTPTIPQNVSISANSATSATLTWDDSEHETSYQIYRWNNKTNTEIITLAANETSYTPTNLIPGEREWFYVKAINGNQSAQSEWQLMVMPLATPTIPQNVSISANSATSATLTWDDSEHETSYQIYRWNNKTNTEIITLAANETSYTPTNLIPGEREWFYVKAINGNQSAQSEWQLMVMPLATPTIPQNVSISANSATSATLTWSDSEHETSYQIYRWNNKTNTEIITLAANETSYTPTNLIPGEREWFYVKAINGNQSAQSEWQLMVMPLATPTVPQNVSISANSPTSATLTWDDSEHETSYQIYRWNNKTNTEIVTLAANATSYTPTNLIPGEREWFYIKAINGNQSAQSEWQLIVMPLA
ncbi:fibronectin type III domain-containing protein [Rosistilla ulvae]|uniref:fibronectin type III domain-containing protein n=1 Tax=Rosistilla ulvae TaxID=1930277 RepID=UPI001C54C5FF|nr:fibronectin type III domain-containing protein [Rosistilla ulvae]